MNYLSVENVTKSFGERVLFKNLTFGIEKGQKVAFIAKNGSGKSTLLSIITGAEGYDEGEVAFRKDIKVGFLSQTPNFNPEDTIFQGIFRSETNELKAIRMYEKAMENPEDGDKLNIALDLMNNSNAWDYEAKIKEILGKLKIFNLDQKMSSLSGGQEKRIALAQVLIEEPDFLILDEPTNHLDVEMIEWLEDYLASANTTLFMVTHDRYFLERVCNEIIELDNQQLYRYKGNYAYFLMKKQEREASTVSSIDKAQNLYRKELEWMRKMPRARGTKAKYRQDAFYETKDKAFQKLDNGEVSIDVNMTRLGNKIIEMHHVRKSFADLNLLDDFSYTFKRKERIGIVGKNGTGKTTFLNLITGRDPEYTGTINIGETVVFGYYHQEGMKIPNDKRVIDVIKDIGEFIPLSKGRTLTAAALLETFLFPKHMHYNMVEKLSGGEKRRLYLLTVIMKNPNFLILDEPTNDLDILTLNVLENFLDEFQGCLIIVSHDRYFMDKLVDHLFIFEGDGKVKDFNGKYTDYQNYLEEKEQEKKDNYNQKNTKKEEKPVKETSDSRKLTYQERQEYNKLEKEIEKLELRKAEITNTLATDSLSNDDLMNLSEEFGKLEKELSLKTDRWLELAEFI